jgi:endonuclease YncB( thermonuclease family)
LDDFQTTHARHEKPLWAWFAAVGLITTLTCFSSHCHAGETYSGTVDYVTDGDTIAVNLDRGGKIKVRFAGIDAPEVRHNNNQYNQAWGQEAKVFLAELNDKKE